MCERVRDSVAPARFACAERRGELARDLGKKNKKNTRHPSKKLKNKHPIHLQSISVEERRRHRCRWWGVSEARGIEKGETASIPSLTSPLPTVKLLAADR